jgi:hypothetical protein
MAAHADLLIVTKVKLQNVEFVQVEANFLFVLGIALGVLEAANTVGQISYTA